MVNKRFSSGSLIVRLLMAVTTVVLGVAVSLVVLVASWLILAVIGPLLVVYLATMWLVDGFLSMIRVSYRTIADNWGSDKKG